MSRPAFMEAEAFLDGHVTVAEVEAQLSRAGWTVSRAVHETGMTTLSVSLDGEDDEEIEVYHAARTGPRGQGTRITADAFEGAHEAFPALVREFGGAHRADWSEGKPFTAVERGARALDLTQDEALKAAFERVLGPQAAADAARVLASDPSAFDALREALDAYAPSAVPSR